MHYFRVKNHMIAIVSPSISAAIISKVNINKELVGRDERAAAQRQRLQQRSLLEGSTLTRLQPVCSFTTYGLLSAYLHAIPTATAFYLRPTADKLELKVSVEP